MEKRHQNSLWNRLELIGINTCKYGIEYEGQKQQAVPQSEAESFGIKEILQFVPHASVYLKKKSSELCGMKTLSKRR